MSSTIADFEGETIARFKYEEGEDEVVIVADYVNKRARIELLDQISGCVVVLDNIGIRELAKFLTEVQRRIDERRS